MDTSDKNKHLEHECCCSTEAIHRKRITETAYYIAEKRGFIPGHEQEDWIAAEKECNKFRYI